jgi:hypothetical protein
MTLSKAHLLIFGSFFVPGKVRLNYDLLEPVNEYSLLLSDLFANEYAGKSFRIFRLKPRMEIEFLNATQHIDVYLYIHEKIYLFWMLIPLKDSILSDESTLQVILQAPVIRWKDKLYDPGLLYSRLLDEIAPGAKKELLLVHKLLYVISPFDVSRLFSQEFLRVIFPESYRSLHYSSFSAILDFTTSIITSKGEILDRSIVELYAFALSLYSFLLTYEDMIIRTFPRMERDIKETIRASVLTIFFSRKLKHVASEITSARIALNYELFMERKFEKRVKQTVHYPLYQALKDVLEIEQSIEKIESEITFLFEMYNVALSIHNEKQLYALKLLMFIIVILEIMMKMEGVL